MSRCVIGDIAVLFRINSRGIADPPKLPRPPVRGAAFLIEVRTVIVHGAHHLVVVSEQLNVNLSGLLNQPRDLRRARLHISCGVQCSSVMSLPQAI